jgi:CheY-like chemotaxis protein
MAEPSDARPCAPPPISDRLRVLVVEDNADCALLLGRLIARLGHDVRYAADGSSALAESRCCPPDVVLLDIGLPDLDGYEVAARLSRIPGPATPFIIALSGHACDEESRQAAGIDVYRTKPVEPEDLRRALGRCWRVTKGGFMRRSDNDGLAEVREVRGAAGAGAPGRRRPAVRHQATDQGDPCGALGE